MTVDKPTNYQSDAFERTARERDLPPGVAVSDFEAMILMAIVKLKPGLYKKEVVREAMEATGRSGTDERLFLRYVDSVVGLGHIARNDFRYYLTVTGGNRLRELRKELAPALNLLTLNVF